MLYSRPLFLPLWFAALGSAVANKHSQRPADDCQQPFMTGKVLAVWRGWHQTTDEDQTHCE